MCITGGEPTLQADLPDFIRKIKELGYLVKLDTNGYRPKVLGALLSEGLLNYVAMDIKNSKEKYAMTAGRESLAITEIEESVVLLKEGTIPYEFRTTVVRELHDEADFKKIGQWLEGAEAYFLQAYRDNEYVIQKGYSAYEKKEMEAFADMLKSSVHRVEVRGME